MDDFNAQTADLNVQMGDVMFHQELEPGAAQKLWVQSQTTFALLGKGEEGEYEVRVVKQKIWVKGTSYELQVNAIAGNGCVASCHLAGQLVVEHR